MQNEMILILDFGSQYTQLIARRVRELNEYCEIHPYNKIPEITANIKGVILSGSPHSVREENPLKPDLSNIKVKCLYWVFATVHNTLRTFSVAKLVVLLLASMVELI